MDQKVLRRLELFPITTTIEPGGLAIGGCNLADLATEYGTPLYVFDAATLSEAAGEYKRTLADVSVRPLPDVRKSGDGRLTRISHRFGGASVL